VKVVIVKPHDINIWHAPNKTSRLSYQISVDFKFSGPKAAGYTMARVNVGGYYKSRPKPKTIIELQETP